MYLNNYIDQLDENSGIVKYAKQSSTFNVQYEFWREHLFERAMRLFVWENTYEIPPKEIEARLLTAGHCGIASFKGELTAFYGTFFGVTKYLDEFKQYIVHCPIYTGTYTIDKDIAIINNTSLRNSLLPLIHHYAVLLGHADVTLTDCLINARNNSGIPIATTNKQKKSIEELQNKTYNGQYGIISDIGNLGINYVNTSGSHGEDIKSIHEVRDKLIKNFYADLGIRCAFEKNNNSVANEVTSDSSYLLLNIDDMLESRRIACDNVNKLFGTNWSVKKNPEIEKEIGGMNNVDSTGTTQTESAE